jgi:hypothetical protein
MEALIESYINQRGADQPGLCMLLHGEHGTGKTHAIRYVMERVARSNLDADSAPIQVYAKPEGVDFMSVYRSLMAQIPEHTLRKVAMRFLEAKVAEQWDRDGSGDATGRSIEAFRSDPDYVEALFKSYRVGQGAVEASAALEISALAGGMEEFCRALSYLMTGDSEMKSICHAWITGKPITAEQSRRLGVEGAISADLSIHAFRLIVTLFGRAERRLLVYIDQYERLTFGGVPEVNERDPVLDVEPHRVEVGEARGRLAAGDAPSRKVTTRDAQTQNADRLHSLVEAIPREGGAFVLCGSEDAYRWLRPDLRARFPNHVAFVSLTPTDADQLLSIYLRDQLPGVFGHDATTTMLRYSGGNLRRFLQIAHIVFEQATRSQATAIDEAMVDEALQNSGRYYFNLSIVKNETSDILASSHVRYQEVADGFDLLDASARVRMMIRFSDAIFHPEEAAQALDHLGLIEKASQLTPPACVAIVVLGYVSAAVAKLLHPVASGLLVYDPESFGDRLTELVRDAGILETANPDLERQLAEVRKQLEILQASRLLEAKTTETLLTDFLRNQKAESDRRTAEERERSAPHPAAAVPFPTEPAPLVRRLAVIVPASLTVVAVAVVVTWRLLAPEPKAVALADSYEHDTVLVADVITIKNDQLIRIRNGATLALKGELRVTGHATIDGTGEPGPAGEDGETRPPMFIERDDEWNRMAEPCITGAGKLRGGDGRRGGRGGRGATLIVSTSTDLKGLTIHLEGGPGGPGGHRGGGTEVRSRKAGVRGRCADGRPGEPGFPGKNGEILHSPDPESALQSVEHERADAIQQQDSRAAAPNKSAMPAGKPTDERTNPPPPANAPAAAPQDKK